MTGARTHGVRMRCARSVLCLALVVCGQVGAAQARLRDDLRGERLYESECAPCHGPTGRGDGPEASYFAPRPRDLRDGFLRLYEKDELVARIRAGQALDIEIDHAALRRRARLVDDILAHLNRLSNVRWEEVERGSEIWAERCERCHGVFGRGSAALDSSSAKTAVDLSAPEFQRRTSDERILELAEHDHASGTTPSALASEGDRSALLEYVRLLSPGFELYTVWCAGCHGDDGGGEGAAAVGADRPGFALDRSYLRAQPSTKLREQVVHMLESQEADMPHLQHRLSEEQVRMIVDYLRATEPAPATPRRE